MRREQLHKINRIATWLIAGMAVANVAWLIVARRTWNKAVRAAVQRKTEAQLRDTSTPSNRWPYPQTKTEQDASWLFFL